MDLQKGVEHPIFNEKPADMDMSLPLAGGTWVRRDMLSNEVNKETPQSYGQICAVLLDHKPPKTNRKTWYDCVIHMILSWRPWRHMKKKDVKLPHLIEKADQQINTGNFLQ